MPVPQEMNFIVEQASCLCLRMVQYSGSQESEVCPMPNAQCPMPYALCPMPYARRVPHVTEKGYISVPTDNANPELRHLFQRRQVRQLAADIPTAENQISQTILNSADCERKLSP